MAVLNEKTGAGAPTDARGKVAAWSGCLLDPRQEASAYREAAHAWCEWGLAFLGVNEDDMGRSSGNFFWGQRLATGKAISPLNAVRCVREYRRTAVFLQGMEAALAAARARFPGEQLHVLEAGCGPLAPLALALALRYPPEEVRFTLLDLHPLGLDGAQKVAAALGVAESIRACVAEDATTVRFAEPDRPHIIVCEVLAQALANEPQVAATLNLAPQLRPGGFFLPERIDLDVGLLDFARQRQAWAGDAVASIEELGNAFSLDAAAIAARQSELPAKVLSIPAHRPECAPLHLFTRLQVFRDHVLKDYDCSLTLPRRLKYPLEFAAEARALEFYYEISANPGLRWKRQNEVASPAVAGP